MPKRGDHPWVQLATRLPKPLHHAVRLHCVTHDVLMMDFVIDAIEAKLGKAGRRAGRRRVSG